MKINKTMCLLIINLLMATGFLFAEITGTDLIFQNDRGDRLFPELNFKGFPSVLTGVKNRMIISDLSLNSRYAESVSERTDDVIGADGGTYMYSSLQMIPALSMTGFLPGKSEDVFGLTLDLNGSFDSIKQEDRLYSSASSHTDSEYKDNLMKSGVRLYYARSFGNSGDLGASAEYSFTWDPTAFESVKDTSGAAALDLYKNNSNQDAVNEKIHTTNLNLSYSYQWKETDLQLGVNYKGYFDDRNDASLLVDSNGDSFYDKIVSRNSYYSSQANTMDYEYSDYSIYNNLNLSLAGRTPINRKLSFIFSGTYTPVDHLYSFHEEHQLSTTVVSDASYDKKYYDAGLASFNLMTGLDFSDINKKSNFRIGFGYERFSQDFTQDSMNTSGTSSAFNSKNTGKLTELSLGDLPDDDSLSGAGMTPVQRDINKLSLLARYRYAPVKDFTIFMELLLSGNATTELYKAYNTDTNTVWSESVMTKGLTWDLSSFVGVGLPISHTWMWTIGVDSDMFLGNMSSASETLPYNETAETSSSGKDLDSELNFDFSIDLKFIYSF